jgi:hypothetical protein
MKKLKPITKDPLERKIASIDIETYGINNRFILGSVVYKDNIKFFDCVKDIKDFLRSDELSDYFIFATNLDFDFFGIFGNVANEEIHPSYSGTRLISIKLIPYGCNERIFLDTLNFLPASVETLGKIINIPKLKKPSWLGNKPKNKTEYEYLKKYNINDSMITYKFMEYLYNGFTEKNIQLNHTIASTSLWSYQKLFMERSFFTPSISILEYIRHAYYGGRTEVFTTGKIKKSLYLYDVNSLYPFSMKNEFADTETLQKMIHDVDISIIKKYHGVSYVEVNAPYMHYPILPFRDDAKRLIFPYGTWKGFYSHNELIYAMENGYKITPLSTVYYEKTFRPFDLFVDTFYSLRKSDPKNSTVYKLILNSLYGKWGQNWDDNFVFKPLTKLKKLPDNFVMEKNGWAILREKGKIPVFANPIFSVYTTAYARILMHKLLIESDALYCDTDSVITAKKLEDSQELGKVKLEQSIKKTILVKPKLYMYETLDDNIKIKTKGFYSKDISVFNNVLEHKKVSNMRFTKFRHSFRSDREVLEKYNHEMEIDLLDKKRVWNSEFSTQKISESKPIYLKDGVKIG